MSDNYWAEELAKTLAAQIQAVWKEKGMPSKLNKDITAAYAKLFISGVSEGFGANLSGLDYDTPDAHMLHSLTQNVYQFSAAKNHTQMRQLSQALLDDNGKLRTWTDFRNNAFKINQEHTITWLKAEYDTSIASAQMARKWVEIQQNKSTLPYLQFDAILDSRTSPICKPLDGVIKPIDDSFWNTYYPPNHFRCRSSVKQLAKGVVTANHKIVHPEKGVPEMFKTNLAKTGMIFPPAHPYWNGVNEEVLKHGQSVLQDDIENWAMANLRHRKFQTSSIGEVEFSGSSIKEIIHKRHYDVNAKNLALYDAENILKNAELVQISPDIKNNEQVLQYYYLKLTISGKPSYINIREYKNKGRKVVYAITDSLKKE